MSNPTLYLFHPNEPISLSTDQLQRILFVVPRLESELPRIQLEGVARTFERASFVVWMRSIFGSDVPKEAYEAIHGDLVNGAVPMPKLQLRQRIPRDHLAAYDSEAHEILVSYALIERAIAPEDENARWMLVAALLEEFGHHVDDLLRTRYSSVGGDAPLDEGAKFAYALLNLEWHAQEQTEIARLIFPFGPKTIEGRWSEYKELIQVWVDGAQQSDLDRFRQYEFFGAGRGKEGKHNVGHSYGHQSIEDALKRADHYFEDKRIRDEVYFGNWLRDISQVVVPPTLKVLSRDAWTKIVDIKARQYFGDKDTFHVDKKILGVYRTEEHLDNPRGVEDGTASDPDLNDRWDEEQCEIDEHTWLQKHLRSHVGGKVSGFENIKKYLTQSARAGSPAERHRYLGAALHAVEDFYAHSNFVEVTLISLGYRNVEPWTIPSNGTRDGKTVSYFPIVTGMFGFSDTAMSLLLELGEDMQKLFACEPGKPTAATEIARIALTDWRPSWGHRYAALLEWKEHWGPYFQWFDTMMCESVGQLAAFFHYTVGGCIRLIGNQIDDAQTVFLTSTDPKVTRNPTHSQVAKDHDDHPLHELAAACAMDAVAAVAQSMPAVWRHEVPVESVLDTVAALMVHPSKITETSPAHAIRARIARWAGQNAATIKKLGSRSWAEDVIESDEFRRGAAELTRAFDQAAAEAQLAGELGLTAYARRRALSFGDFLRKWVTEAEARSATTLDGFRTKAHDQLEALSTEQRDATVEHFRVLVDERLRVLASQGHTTFEVYQERMRREFDRVTSEQVMAKARDEIEEQAERSLQSLHSWTEEHLRKLEGQAQTQRDAFEHFLQTFDPMQVAADKLAQIRTLIDNESTFAVNSAKAADDELHKSVSELKKEFGAPESPTATEKLVDAEVSRLRAKLRALVDAASHSPLSTAPTAQREAFVQEQVARLKSILQRALSNGSSATRKRVVDGADQELDRLQTELHKPSQDVQQSASSGKEQAKQTLHPAKTPAQPDVQLEYVEQLKPTTRGIVSRGGG